IHRSLIMRGSPENAMSEGEFYSAFIYLYLNLLFRGRSRPCNYSCCRVRTRPDVMCTAGDAVIHIHVFFVLFLGQRRENKEGLRASGRRQQVSQYPLVFTDATVLCDEIMGCTQQQKTYRLKVHIEAGRNIGEQLNNGGPG